MYAKGSYIFKYLSTSWGWQGSNFGLVANTYFIIVCIQCSFCGLHRLIFLCSAAVTILMRRLEDILTKIDLLTLVSNLSQNFFILIKKKMLLVPSLCYHPSYLLTHPYILVTICVRRIWQISCFCFSCGFNMYILNLWHQNVDFTCHFSLFTPK